MWGGLLHGRNDVEVGLARVARVNSALHANLGCTARPRFDTASAYFFGADIVGFAAQILARAAFRKGAELAFEVTNIGVINIAVNYKADSVSANRMAQGVGSSDYRVIVIAAAAKQRGDFGFCNKGFI